MIPKHFMRVLPFAVAAAALLVYPTAAKKRNKIQPVSYQPAKPAGSYTPAEPQGYSYVITDGKTVRHPAQSDPNTTTVRASDYNRSKLTPAQQIGADLLRQKKEVQQQIDLLGRELATARRGRARKITKELDRLADKSNSIDRKMALLPRSAFDFEENEEAEKAEVRRYINDLIQQRMDQKGYIEPEPEISDIVEQAVIRPDYETIVYRIQLAVVNRPNPGAFGRLDEVQEVRRSDGRYAYYQGNFQNRGQAEEACRRLRMQNAYRDAFVVAMKGDQVVKQ